MTVYLMSTCYWSSLVAARI